VKAIEPRYRSAPKAVGDQHLLRATPLGDASIPRNANDRV
jgi:hypothetical protein